VVSLVVSEALHARHPDDDEGLLSARRAAIVSTAGLARLGRRLELGDYLQLGEGEAQRGGRSRPALLASGLEALAAAVFLDRGWETARDWLADLAAREIAADAAPAALKSPKSRLQELSQRRSGERPAYRLVDVSGPDHQRRFVVEVALGGSVVGTGEGASRRAAESAAAAAALDTLAGQPRRVRGAGHAAEGGPAADGSAGADDGDAAADGLSAADGDGRAGS
jgi:ribonuclease-3